MKQRRKIVLERIDKLFKGDSRFSPQMIKALKKRVKANPEKYAFLSKTDEERAAEEKAYDDERKAYQTPKFKKGDFIEYEEYELGYAKVVYEIMKIFNSGGELFYDLKGRKIISHDGTDPYMSEAKSYDPLCHYFDTTTAKKVPKPKNCTDMGQTSSTLRRS